MKIKKNTRFIVKCPNCKKEFELTLFQISCHQDECSMCGSHQSFTLTCKYCDYEQEEREI
jgi:rRNA maturation endonuclease Nob1